MQLSYFVLTQKFSLICLHNAEDQGHVADVGNILDPADAVYQKGCGKNGHSGILCAADFNLAVERFAAADHVFCQNGHLLLSFSNTYTILLGKKTDQQGQDTPVCIYHFRFSRTHVCGWIRRLQERRP